MGILNWFVETNKGDKPKLIVATPQTAIEYTTPISSSTEEIAKYEQQLLELLVSQGDKRFFEFVDTKKAMRFNGAEADAYSALSAVFSLRGMTKDVIINSANKTLEILNKELSDFDIAYKKQVTDQKLKDQVSIDEKRKKISEAQQLINTLNVEMSDIQQISSSRISALSAKNDAFTKAGNNLATILNEEINKITKYVN